MKPNQHSNNVWGHPIRPPREVVRNLGLRPALESLLASVTGIIGLSEVQRDNVRSVAFHPGDYPDQDTYERALKNAIIPHSRPAHMVAAIRNRSQIATDAIKRHLVGDSLLDVGCGNGSICWAIREQFKRVQMLDVLNYVWPEVILPYSDYVEGDSLPYGQEFDTVLVLTVLHHSSDPMRLLEEAWRVTKKRLIIIESVFGAHDSDLKGRYALAGRSEEDQLDYAIYVDWLYNRVLHDDVPAPYNFTTPNRWQQVFEGMGMKVTAAINLGQDIPIAPELHYLFVLDRP